MSGDMDGLFVVFLILALVLVAAFAALVVTAVGGLAVGVALRRHPWFAIPVCGVGAPAALGLLVAAFSSPELGWAAGLMALLTCVPAASLVAVVCALRRKRSIPQG